MARYFDLRNAPKGPTQSSDPYRARPDEGNTYTSTQAGPLPPPQGRPGDASLGLDVGQHAHRPPFTQGR
jgi:hypothetical protein